MDFYAADFCFYFLFKSETRIPADIPHYLSSYLLTLIPFQRLEIIVFHIHIYMEILHKIVQTQNGRLSYQSYLNLIQAATDLVIIKEHTENQKKWLSLFYSGLLCL